MYIPFEHRIRDYTLDRCTIHRRGTSILHSLEETLALIFDLGCHIILPTVGTEPMAASQCKRFVLHRHGGATDRAIVLFTFGTRIQSSAFGGGRRTIVVIDWPRLDVLRFSNGT